MSGKILTREGLIAAREAARHEGRAVVQCHGCFDIVHPGHVRHLRQAKAQGDVLLVSITGDRHIAKGQGRPLIPEELRAENLAALDFVDWVHVDDSATAEELLGTVRPDVYVKGREYEHNHDERFARERAAVESGGGRVVFSSGDVVFSSTALIAAMESSVDPYHHRLASLLNDERCAGPALSGVVGAMRGKRVVIVGETILDVYVLCDRPEVAGESPVMTLRPLEHRRYDGGAAIVARHAAAMGARPVLVTGMPEDEVGRQVRARLVGEGIEVRHVRTDESLAEKQRFLVGAQKVMKVDLVDPITLDASRQDALVGTAVDAAREGCDALVITDFGLGLFTPSMLSRVCMGARPHAGVVSGDVSGKRSSLLAMRRADLLCPSEQELRDALRVYDEGLPAAAWRLMSETQTRQALVTMGPEGLVAFDKLPGADEDQRAWNRRLRAEHVPALSAHAIDPLGCGDALLTAATLALASGASLLGAAMLGSLAAACEGSRVGNVPVSAADLRQAVARLHASHLTLADPEIVSRPARRAS